MLLGKWGWESGKETDRNNNRETERDRQRVRHRKIENVTEREKVGFCRAVHTCWSAWTVKNTPGSETYYSLRAAMKLTATGLLQERGIGMWGYRHWWFWHKWIHSCNELNWKQEINENTKPVFFSHIKRRKFHKLRAIISLIWMADRRRSIFPKIAFFQCDKAAVCYQFFRGGT